MTLKLLQTQRWNFGEQLQHNAEVHLLIMQVSSTCKQCMRTTAHLQLPYPEFALLQQRLLLWQTHSARGSEPLLQAAQS